MRVYDVVRLVPRGRVTTYGAVATAALSPRAARAVGRALSAAGWGPYPVPWQRVINSGGQVSAHNDPGRAARQRALLEAEGIAFDADDRIDLETYGWWG